VVRGCSGCSVVEKNALWDKSANSSDLIRWQWALLLLTECALGVRLDGRPDGRWQIGYWGGTTPTTRAGSGRCGGGGGSHPSVRPIVILSLSVPRFLDAPDLVLSLSHSLSKALLSSVFAYLIRSHIDNDRAILFLFLSHCFECQQKWLKQAVHWL